MRLRWSRRRSLADQIRPYIPCESNEPMVDADPIRMFLYRWMIETGDPIEVVAKGFDLSPALVNELISGDLRGLSSSHASEISRRLGLPVA